jgi:hypothetical protein
MSRSSSLCKIHRREARRILRVGPKCNPMFLVPASTRSLDRFRTTRFLFSFPTPALVSVSRRRLRTHAKPRKVEADGIHARGRHSRSVTAIAHAVQFHNQPRLLPLGQARDRKHLVTPHTVTAGRTYWVPWIYGRDLVFTHMATRHSCARTELLDGLRGLDYRRCGLSLSHGLRCTPCRPLRAQ